LYNNSGIVTFISFRFPIISWALWYN